MSQHVSKLLGMVIGSVLIVGAVIAIFFVDWTVEPPPPEVPIRPIKTFVVESAFATGGRRYPGRVAASEEVDLAFQVAGPIVEFPVKEGQEVEAGAVIAKLDSRDFENELKSAIAMRESLKERYERVKKAREDNAATELEVINAKSAYDSAEADVSIRQKAVEDTVLKAPFTGVIATTYVENFQNVQAKQVIARLADVTEVEIKINVPEQRVTQRREKDKVKLTATLDFLPGREFDVTVKEYSTEADPITQTYEVTLVMPAPDDVRILPGMTATVIEQEIVDESAPAKGYAVPVAIVPIDGTGGYYVWKIEPGESGVATVKRVDVKVGEMVGDNILVTEGVAAGDRLAAAGVTLLNEGQKVRILRPKSERSDG